MTEPHYRMTIADINLVIPQGVTFEQRWEIRFNLGTTPPTYSPFPFFDESFNPLWTGRCQMREFADDPLPLISLTTLNSGVSIDYIETDGVITQTFYSIFITELQTAMLTPRKVYYDIEFKRTSDSWVIKPQKGKVTTIAEITK